MTSVFKPENPVVDVNSLSPEEVRMVQKAILTLESKVPALFCGLNVAQYRAFKAMYTPDKKSGLIPALGIIKFANGVGKTHSLVLDMKGWTQGPDYLNWKAFPEEALDYWNSYSVRDLRDRGLLSLRLVCMSDDMKADGSVLSIIKSLFPEAKLTGMDNSKCYREIDVLNPNSKTLVINKVGVRTFDQDEIKHSGSTCQRIWINEPLPENLIGETVGRIRSKKGSTTGSIAMFGTLLGHSKFANELGDDDDIRVVQVKGHLYENCIGEDVTDEMALEVREKVGVQLEKNANGPGYITNGVLELGQIKSMIALWRKACPHQLEARKSGEPLSEGGAIYVNYKREYHVVPRSTYSNIPKNWPIVQVVDPHSARAAFSIWVLITPANRGVVIEEWPTVKEFDYYDKMSYRPYTVPQECDIWRKIEAELGISEQIVKRIGDPNRFLDPDPYTNLTLKVQYGKHGFDFWTEVNDNIVTGHEVVNQALDYDELRLKVNPSDLHAMPRLIICDNCENVDRAMKNYGFKIERRTNGVTEVPLEKFKDPCDCVRYFEVYHTNNGFNDVKIDSKRLTDFDKIKIGRNPERNNYENYPTNFKGRKLLGSYKKKTEHFCSKGY